MKPRLALLKEAKTAFFAEPLRHFAQTPCISSSVLQFSQDLSPLRPPFTPPHTSQGALVFETVAPLFTYLSTAPSSPVPCKKNGL